jgi:hypothetical protein
MGTLRDKNDYELHSAELQGLYTEPDTEQKLWCMYQMREIMQTPELANLRISHWKAETSPKYTTGSRK